ncbi:hypothetical protein CCMA1212_009665 [Trichoderma ghanense]|uniref:Uncharacterized protein n=1 Tax=Trichoderma ghanense TaxID=65468 RepID=A0ABY2GRZ4_9HYPO
MRIQISAGLVRQAQRGLSAHPPVLASGWWPRTYQSCRSQVSRVRLVTTSQQPLHSHSSLMRQPEHESSSARLISRHWKNGERVREGGGNGTARNGAAHRVASYENKAWTTGLGMGM